MPPPGSARPRSEAGDRACRQVGLTAGDLGQDPGDES